MKHVKFIVSLLLFALVFSGFWSAKSEEEIRKENNQKKENRIKTNNEIMQQLYKYDPDTRNMVLRAYGYATFTNMAVHFAIISIEGGYGVVHNNKTGKNIYMNMASIGIGPGMAVKDFDAVFLFKDKEVFDNFVNSGLEANAQLDATAKAGDLGGSINAAVTVKSGVRIYKITQNGLSLQATFQGSKYWKDENLN